VTFRRNVMGVSGLESEKIPTKEALAGPHGTHGATQHREEDQIGILGQALKDLIKRELKTQDCDSNVPSQSS